MRLVAISSWARRRGLPRRAVVLMLVTTLVAQTWGCAGSTRVIPFGTRITEVHPIRYYDMWNALRIGRGVLVGIGGGKSLGGEFISGSSRSITIRTSAGWNTIPVRDIRYLVNVIDLSHARDGAIAGGIIGLGTGLAVGYLTNGSGSTSNTKVARGADDAYDVGNSTSESASGESGSTTSESSADTSPSGSSSETSQSTVSDASDAGGEASSSNESSSGDATNPGSTAAEGSSTGSDTDESGGSSVGSDGNATTQNSTQSSEESSVVVNVYSESSGSSTGSGSAGDPSQPSTSSTRAWRSFFYAVGFSAIGTFLGWLVGRPITKRTPRVDYVVFPEATRHEGITAEEHIVREMVLDSHVDLNDMIPPGSQFDSPRSASLYSRHSVESQPVMLHPEVGAVIKEQQAARYRLFPAADNFIQAVILRVATEGKRLGDESRYVAVVVSERRHVPTVQLQRLSASDVIRMSTQVRLLRRGIVQ